MYRIRLFLVLLLASAALHAERAGASVECVKTQCEGKGRICVETAHSESEACLRAARSKCNAVPAAEKFSCLRDGLSPCAQTRNAAQSACLAGVQACYKSCGPLPGKRNDYWCVANLTSGATGAFCAADPAAASPLAQCAKAFGNPEALNASMACDSLH